MSGLVASDRAPGLFVAPDVVIPDDAVIGAHVVIRAGVVLGRGVVIEDAVTLGKVPPWARVGQPEARRADPHRRRRDHRQPQVINAGADIGAARLRRRPRAGPGRGPARPGDAHRPRVHHEPRCP